MDNKADFFSALTSSLLVTIVSLLPFKEAVRTSILSKQWLSIWPETTNLEFYESFFVHHGDSEENQRVRRNRFVQFIGNLLQDYPRKSIERFILTCSRPNDFLAQMRQFIGFAVSHNVRELELDFSDPNWDEYDDEEHNSVLDLPLDPNQPSRIESLKLFMCNLDVSFVTSLGVLKNISLGWIELNMASVNALLVNCPLLESLTLKKCWGLEYLKICIPDLRLKNLVIDKCNFLQDSISIDGPKLKFLKYSGVIGHFLLFNQRELVEVDLDFGMEPEFDDEVGNLLYNFVAEFYAAQILTVCSVFLQMIPQGDEPFSLEDDLEVRHLTLKTGMHSNEYVGMKFILNSCPKLQTLTFDIVDNAKIFPDYDAPFTINEDEYWSKDLIVEKCIETSLEVVNVKGFKGSKSELDILEYIMQYGQRLTQVNLYVSEDGNKEQYLANVELVKSFRTSSLNHLYLYVF